MHRCDVIGLQMQPLKVAASEVGHSLCVYIYNSLTTGAAALLISTRDVVHVIYIDTQALSQTLEQSA